MSEITLITKDEYISALAIVRAYERQVEIMADTNITSGVIHVGTPGYWYEDKVGLAVDVRPATYLALTRAGIEKEDISLYYEIISDPYRGYLVLKDNLKLNHK